MPVQLLEPQWLRLATLLAEDSASATSTLERWRDEGSTLSPSVQAERQLSRVHDVHSLVDSCWLEGDHALGDVEALARLAREQRPWPEASALSQLGVTEVLLAGVSDLAETSRGDRRVWVQQVLDTLAGGAAGQVVGGRLSRGVEVWGADDPALVLVLRDAADPRAEAAAGRFLLGPFRLIEIARHKINNQDQLFRRQVRPCLEEAVLRLDNLLLCWTDELRAAAKSLDADDPALLERAWSTRAEATQAAFKLWDAMKTAESLRATIQANRANLRGLLARLSASPARRCLADRWLRAGLAVEQIDTVLTAARASRDQVEWTGSLHQSRLRTALYRLEQEENQLRERGNRRLVFLGLAIGLLQVWTGVAALLPDREGSTSLVVMLLLLIVAMSVLAVVWWVGEQRGQSPRKGR